MIFTRFICRLQSGFPEQNFVSCGEKRIPSICHIIKEEKPSIHSFIGPVPIRTRRSASFTFRAGNDWPPRSRGAARSGHVARPDPSSSAPRILPVVLSGGDMDGVPELINLSISLRIQPNEGPVFYKVDGTRFGQTRTIKLLTGSKYKIEVVMKPGTVEAT